MQSDDGTHRNHPRFRRVVEDENVIAQQRPDCVDGLMSAEPLSQQAFCRAPWRQLISRRDLVFDDGVYDCMDLRVWQSDARASVICLDDEQAFRLVDGEPFFPVRFLRGIVLPGGGPGFAGDCCTRLQRLVGCEAARTKSPGSFVSSETGEPTFVM